MTSAHWGQMSLDALNRLSYIHTLHRLEASSTISVPLKVRSFLPHHPEGDSDAVHDADLTADVGNMSFHLVFSEIEFVGDRLVRFALRHHAGDGEFQAGQHTRRRLGPDTGRRRSWQLLF